MAFLLFAACGDDDSDFATRSDGKELTEGMLTDSRNGQTYKTVSIASQTWMAENLNMRAQTVTATKILLNIAPNTVAFTLGLPRKSFVRAAGICRQRSNLKS